MLLLTGALFCFPSDAVGETAVHRPAIIQAGAVNVREQPTESSGRIGGLTLGKEVYVHDMTVTDGKVWYRIDYDNGIGYILGTTAQLVKEIGMAVTYANVQVAPVKGNIVVLWGELSIGEGVYILAKETESDGSEWYQVYYDGHTGYVLTQYLQIASLPTRAQTAQYKRDVWLEVTGQNIPKGYALGIDSEKYISAGGDKCTAAMPFGQLTKDTPVAIYLYNADGNLVEETEVTVKVNNGFFAKLLAYFGFVFSGFRWTKQIVEIV